MAPPAVGVFPANPLSLSVPEPEFESWLRETGFLEVLDERASSSGAVSGAAKAQRRRSPFSDSSLASASPSTSSSSSSSSSEAASAFPGRRYFGLSGSTVLSVRTLISILTVNPFAKLAAEDFSRSTPPWTIGFLTAGSRTSSYSWPGGPSLARMRIQENVKRYARNYASLWLIILACTLYKMPLALFGLVLSLGIWELLWFASDSWDPQERYPGIRFALVRIAQLATAAVLYYCHLQQAIFCAISISYTVMVLHASLRRLSSPSKPLTGPTRPRRSHQIV